jgi:hypothetical protein
MKRWPIVVGMVFLIEIGEQLGMMEELEDGVLTLKHSQMI